MIWETSEAEEWIDKIDLILGDFFYRFNTPPSTISSGL